MAADGGGRRGRLGEAAAEWASSRWIDVGGRRVRYRQAGEGGSLVLVHGLGVSADYWTRNGSAIAAQGFRVLAPDLPGFGRTEGSADGLDVGQQAIAVRDWAAAMGLGPATFLGHSLSCQSVLELAVVHPELVRGLVLVAPTGEGIGYRRLIRQAIGLARDVHRESFKLSAMVLQAYLSAGPGRVMRTWKMGASHDPMPLLPRVGVPVLVVLGDNDPVVEPEFADRIVTALPRGRLVTIPGGSHAVIFEPTGAFNAAVVEFMRSLDGRDSP
ncbi:MAG: alpha/beta hydrolase [Gemmatimonadota bacterium]